MEVYFKLFRVNSMRKKLKNKRFQEKKKNIFPIINKLVTKYVSE
jgi:hypothetical protein